jgi:hypothetical protein
VAEAADEEDLVEASWGVVEEEVVVAGSVANAVPVIGVDPAVAAVRITVPSTKTLSQFRPASAVSLSARAERRLRTLIRFIFIQIYLLLIAVFPATYLDKNVKGVFRSKGCRT